MGCRITKPEVIGDQPQEGKRVDIDEDMLGHQSRSDVRQAEFKARLERQMCLAKETPEPEFVLADCDLKTIPSGVFILCRVLRKERLDLRTNRLRSLESGGSLIDLALLTTLDLRENNFKRLPEELDQLANLRVNNK